ncbi:MAG: hypothetical protein IT223_01455 [Crocinitomicaceae bacterium]|nr:hypothetical protein [Crocinitomicaceae bacterium]
MNKALIYQVLEDPAILASLPIEELEKISSAYPWFMAVQVLLAKAYQQKNDHRFTDQLHQAALYSPDRRVLYEYIKKEETIGETQKESEVEKHPIASEVTLSAPDGSAVALHEEVTISSPGSEEGSIASTDNAIVPEIFTDQHLPSERNDIDAEIPSFPEEDIPSPTDFVASGKDKKEEQNTEVVSVKAHDINDLDRQIIVEAVSSIIGLEEANTESAPPSVTAGHSAIASQMEISAGAANNDEDEPESFAAWVIRRARQVHYAEETGISEYTTNETKTGNEKSKISSLTGENEGGIAHSIHRIRPESEKSHQQQLMDRFIQNEPKIIQGKITDYTPGNLAKESLEEDPGLVTETIAKLFAAQGKIEKARKAYKKLMEQYPEKSIYFAAQLKNLNLTKKG